MSEAYDHSDQFTLSASERRRMQEASLAGQSYITAQQARAKSERAIVDKELPAIQSQINSKAEQGEFTLHLERYLHQNVITWLRANGYFVEVGRDSDGDIYTTIGWSSAFN